MNGESVAILVLCVIMTLYFARSKYSKYSYLVSPIAIIPGVYLLTKGLLKITKEQFFNFRPEIVMGFAIALALAATCILIVVLSTRIQVKTMRRVYIVMLWGYSVAIGWAYIFHSLSRIMQ